MSPAESGRRPNSQYREIISFWNAESVISRKGRIEITLVIDGGKFVVFRLIAADGPCVCDGNDFGNACEFWAWSSKRAGIKLLYDLSVF